MRYLAELHDDQPTHGSYQATLGKSGMAVREMDEWLNDLNTTPKTWNRAYIFAHDAHARGALVAVIGHTAGRHFWVARHETYGSQWDLPFANDNPESTIAVSYYGRDLATPELAAAWAERMLSSSALRAAAATAVVLRGSALRGSTVQYAYEPGSDGKPTLVSYMPAR